MLHTLLVLPALRMKIKHGVDFTHRQAADEFLEIFGVEIPHVLERAGQVQEIVAQRAAFCQLSELFNFRFAIPVIIIHDGPLLNNQDLKCQHSLYISRIS